MPWSALSSSAHSHDTHTRCHNLTSNQKLERCNADAARGMGTSVRAPDIECLVLEDLGGAMLHLHVMSSCQGTLPIVRVQHKRVTIRSRQAGSAGHARHQHGFDVHASRTGSMATRTVLPRPQVGAERQRRVTPCCAQTRPSAEKVSYCTTSTGAALRACTSPVYSSSSNPDECMCYLAQMT